MKKTLSMILALALLLSALCIAPAMADDTPTLTLALTGDNTPTEDNAVKKALEDRLGIKLNIIYVPAADYTAKLNTLIAAKTLPDVFIVDSEKLDIVEMKEAGILLKMDGLLETHGPDLTEQLGDVLMTCPVNQEDGVYAVIPAMAWYASNLSIRTDWLDNVGLKMPATLDELYEVIKAFTLNDPDKNGKNDTIGYVATMANMRTFEHIFGAYGICVDKSYLMDDGTVTTYMKAPQYLEAIKFLRKLYQEGLLDPDFATMPLMSAFEKLWTGRTGMLDFQNVGTTNNWMPSRYVEDPAPNFDFAIIKGENGIGGPIKQYPSYSTYIAISSKTQYPEKAMELLNYLYSKEGDELTYLGVEGKHFEWIDEDAGTYRLLGEYTDSATGRADGVFVYNKQWAANNCEVRTLNKLTRYGQELANANAVEYPFIIATLESRSEYGPTLDEITKEAFAQLIVTKGDVDAEYAAFVARWDEEGGLEYEEEATRVYAEEQAAAAAAKQ